MAKALKKPKKQNGYKMPDPLPPGEILTDMAKKNWRLGKSIGMGGFGEIYLAQDATKKSSEFPYVIKVEPHGNGPLFVEMHFYMKNAKNDDIQAFMQKHKLKTFGMPAYFGSGSHQCGDAKFRFIVMEKFGQDIDKIRAEHNGCLVASNVFQIAWQLTLVLQYIHELGYVHADIKGGNVLMGATKENKSQAYLLDFGLATKFTTAKEFKPNPKKAHDGTIEYLSRDAHQGVPTKRGDFEILGYNLIHWLGGILPWDHKLQDPKVVQQLKEESFKDIKKFVKTSLKKQDDVIVALFEKVNSLDFNETPDYKFFLKLFENGIKKNGGDCDGTVQMQMAHKRSSKEKKTESIDSLEKENVVKKRQRKENGVINGSTEIMTDAMKEVLEKKRQKEEKQKSVKSKKKLPEVHNAAMLEVQEKLNTGAIGESTRSGRNLPRVNYDERTPRIGRKKY